MNVKDVFARNVTALHRSLFHVSNGRIGGRLFGMPVLELTTTGRKSGRKRTTMLTAPIVEGDRVVLVASYGGDPRHPTWFLNLRDDPDVEIVMGGRKRRVRARVASPEEKEAMWPRVVAAYKGYGGYQRRTDRDIPLVVLEP